MPMSRKGDCYDNAPMESFWGSLKNELVHHERSATREQARNAITECEHHRGAGSSPHNDAG
jgi:putative transposase